MQSGRGFEYGVHHLLSPREGLLSEVICEKISVLESEVLNLLKFGAVYLKNSRLTHNVRVNENNLIRIHTKPRRFLRSVDWGSRIACESDDFILIDKPSGLPCHSTVDNLFENVLTQISGFLQKPVYLTHRLDVPTSGLLVLGKTTLAQGRFNQALAQSEVVKIYEALVEGTGLKIGRYQHYMKTSPRAPKVISSEPLLDSLVCILNVLNVEVVGSHTRVRIQLETGRTHQIRAQMAFLGFPIVGDVQYGASQKINSEWDEIRLRAVEIAWPEYFSAKADFTLT